MSAELRFRTPASCVAAENGYLYTREDWILVSICAIIKRAQATKHVKGIINDFGGSDVRFEER